MSIAITVTIDTDNSEIVPSKDDVEREVIRTLKQSPRLGEVVQKPYGFATTWRDVPSRTEAQRALDLFIKGEIHEPWRSAFRVTTWDDGELLMYSDGSSLWVPVDGPAEVRNR